ncbi:MAG TPA: 3-oxo-tetronate kinase [Burkholderiaceae bacterium]|nr:3-oxo-tetronate kinase [Burkholderiaceae bacterium]
MFIGAIADDLTGATDLALMLSRGGLRTIQTIGVPTHNASFDGIEAVVVALKSRTIPAADAVAQSLAAARALLDHGVEQLFFKYCSTFDSTDAGNIGPVTDALLELLGETTTIACPAFPANGRTVYNGHLFVGDKLLSESSMRNHPLTPMRDANLVRVLQRQSRNAVFLISCQTVSQGPEAIAAQLARNAGIAIVDAIDEADLRVIGRAARSLRLITGGSGIGLSLGGNFPARGGHAPAPVVAAPGGSVILAGSCSAATRRQVEVAIAAGLPARQLDPIAIADGRTSVADAIEFVLAAPDQTPLLFSSADPVAVSAVQDRLGRATAGEVVENFLADTAAQLLERGVTRFLVAGGETSGAVVSALRVSALDIGPEIDPGVPWTLARDGKPIALALKSGNFGADDFFLKAWKLLP